MTDTIPPPLAQPQAVVQPPVRRRLLYRPRLPHLLRQTPFRRYWSAQTISLLGDQITVLALPLLAVLGAGAGPAQMGYLTAAALVPNLLFSVVIGAWIDRYPYRRRIMILADIGRALLLVTVPAAYLLDALTLQQLYVVAFASGTLSMLFEVSHSTLFVSLVGRQDYVAANTLVNGSRAMSYVAGPSAGGVLVQALTAPFALLADAISYLASAAFLARIRPVEPPPSQDKSMGLGRGLRYLAGSRLLRSIMLGTTTLNLFNYMFAALFVLYVSTELGISPALLGAIIGAGALGAVLGAAVTGRLARRLGIGRTLVLGFVVFPAPLVLIPLAGGPTRLVVATLVLAEFLAGLGVMMLDITANSMMTAAIPDALRARVSGAQRTVNYGIRPIGALLGGALGATLGIRTTLWIATIGAIAGVLWVLPEPATRLRDVSEVTPAPQ